MTKALSHTKKRERTVIVVGEFGEEESAHFDDGANQKQNKIHTHTHTQKTRANESSERESWVGRLVGQGLASTHTDIAVGPVRDADYPSTALQFFFCRLFFYYFLFFRDDIDIEKKKMDRAAKDGDTRKQEEKWEE